MQSENNILVAGIGNPLLRDDTIGLHAVTCLENRIAPAKRNGIVFKQLFCGGFDLLSELANFSRAFIIDCLCDGETMPGEIKRFSVSSKDLLAHAHRPLAAGHGIDLSAVLSAGRTCGYAMPDPVVVYGIGASDVCTFDESPTPQVFAVLDQVAESIHAEIFGKSTSCIGGRN